MAIDQGDMEFVRNGLKVDLFLDPLPGRQLATEIGAISASEMKASPRSLSQKSGGELLTVTDESGRERPGQLHLSGRRRMTTTPQAPSTSAPPATPASTPAGRR